MKINRN